VKVRIDKLLVERGLAPTRERAQALILAGKVLVNDQKLDKCGTAVAEDCAIRLLGGDLRYVSRGGLKLERALEHWHIEVSGRTCMDVGTSTGGFTDCLLQNDAAQVIAVDTGFGQIDLKLRNDPRVRLLERTNARYLTSDQIAPLAVAPVTLIVMDVSFISATLVLPAVIAATLREHAGRGRDLIVLVKPQFEVGREQVGKGGIVRSAEAQQGAISRVRDAIDALGGQDIEVIDSPILGGEGNKEFLLHALFPGTIESHSAKT
jgi:23S rRNA (cytidine1920-2'-O)/16S rRNA (cytidine1409-2'-O)-methyltransferase